MSLFGQKQKTVEPDVIPTTVEQAIPIRDVCEDGIFLVGRNLWSKTYRFTDVNYATASKEDKEGMFFAYTLLLTIWSKAITAQESSNAKSGVKIMASSKEYLHFILEQLSDLDDISYRPMMGEFILYYHGKIVGGIYDDRLLVKKTRTALELMPAAICELPYEGAKEMLLVDEVDSKEFLTKLFKAMYDELPSPKRKNNGMQ